MKSRIWNGRLLLLHENSLIKQFKFIQQKFLHNFRPRRALLYVPGNDERKIQKASKLDVDCVALDCEDGVAANQKDTARNTIAKFLNNTTLNKYTDWCVRVNSVESGLLLDDLRAICSEKQTRTHPPTLLLPKVNAVDDFNYFNECIKNCFGETKPENKIGLIFYAESCRTIMNLPEICSHAIKLGENSIFQPLGIVFGSDDFLATLGGTRTNNSIEILYARQRVVLIAKAFQLQAIDMVYIDFKDLNGVREQSLEGARMGYSGKQVIHPGQVDIVQ